MSQKVEVEARGATIEAAIEAGLAQIKMSRSEVIVDVVDEGSRGLLGIGARDAVVRLTGVRRTPPPAVQQPKSAPVQTPSRPEAVVQPPTAASAPARVEEPAAPAVATAPEPVTAAASDEVPDEAEAAAAQDVLQRMLDKMLVKATIEVKHSEPDDLTGRRVNILDVQGEDLTILIGSRGETLNALQYISRLMVGHRLQQRATFVLDVQGYRQRRELALSRLAERMAKKAVSRKRPVTLEPMPPYERRIIHMALRNHGGVTTESKGEGRRRKVQILPK